MMLLYAVISLTNFRPFQLFSIGLKLFQKRENLVEFL